MENQQSRPRQAPGEAEIEASWQSAKDDGDKLEKLWQQHGHKLLKVSSRVADPNEIQQTLDTALKTDSNAEQIVLEQSTLAGNVALFQHMLQRMPDPLLGQKLRLNAITGGVDIWRALLAYKHECINWDIGEHGDALAKP